MLLMAGSVVGCSSMISGAYDGGAPPEGTEFHIARATFKKDKTFNAYAKFADGEGGILNGVYEFDGFHLKLKQAGKPERTYNASYNSFSRTLNITSPGGKSQSLKRM